MTDEKILEILKAPRENYQEVMRRINIKSMPVDSNQKYAFFSYSHNDASKVSEIFKKLYENGYNIWLDAANLSHGCGGWENEARDALLHSNCALVVFFRSETSVLSENIYTELSEAENKQRFYKNENRNRNRDLLFSISVVDIWGEGENCDKYQSAIKNLRLKMDLAYYSADKIDLVKDTENSLDEVNLVKNAESRLNELYKIVKSSANAIQGEVENITMEIAEEFDKHKIYKRPTVSVVSTVEKTAEQKPPSSVSAAVDLPTAQKAKSIPAPKVKLNPVHNVDEVLTTEHILTPTEPKYKIFTFGPTLHIGFGVPVTVCYNGQSYEGKTHSISKGRVDGMGKLFKESPELQAGISVTARLSCSDHILTVAVK